MISKELSFRRETRRIYISIFMDGRVLDDSLWMLGYCMTFARMPITSYLTCLLADLIINDRQESDVKSDSWSSITLEGRRRITNFWLFHNPVVFSCLIWSMEITLGQPCSIWCVCEDLAALIWHIYWVYMKSSWDSKPSKQASSTLDWRILWSSSSNIMRPR